jgi:hypothetical protein
MYNLWVLVWMTLEEYKGVLRDNVAKIARVCNLRLMKATFYSKRVPFDLFAAKNDPNRAQ